MTGSESLPTDAAIEGARRALELDALPPARTWSVARTEQGAHGYLLVVFGPPSSALAIAAVDPDSGEVLESARLPGDAPHALLSADEATRRAGFGPGTQARLVWDPTAASRSRFYPFWELRNAGRHAWVDSVRGEVRTTLEVARGGG
jgi:hypothetical protein